MEKGAPASPRHSFLSQSSISAENWSTVNLRCVALQQSSRACRLDKCTLMVWQPRNWACSSTNLDFLQDRQASTACGSSVHTTLVACSRSLASLAVGLHSKRLPSCREGHGGPRQPTTSVHLRQRRRRRQRQRQPRQKTATVHSTDVRTFGRSTSTIIRGGEKPCVLAVVDGSPCRCQHGCVSMGSFAASPLAMLQTTGLVCP